MWVQVNITIPTIKGMVISKETIAELKERFASPELLSNEP